MYSHQFYNHNTDVTPPVYIKPEEIRDLDGFVRKMASRINLVI
jgi:hypothetical protein